jgi:hypothetical protein
MRNGFAGRAFAAGALLLSACGGGEPRARGGEGAEVPAWTLAAAPEVEVGAREDDPGHALHNVVGAVRLPGGRIVVANAGSRELLVFGPEGGHAATLGRKGRGPGEFEALAWVGHLRADTVVAWDHSLLRWSLFTPEGFVRAVTPSPEPGGMFPRAMGVLDDGSLVIGSGWNVSALAAGGAGLRRDTVAFTRYGRDGRLLGTVARAPGRQEYVTSGPAGFATSVAPFARETFLAVSGSEVWLGDSDGFRIERRAAGGDVLGAISRAWKGAPVRPGDVERHKRERLERIVVDSYRQQQERVLEEMPFPPTAPAFGALLADDGGRVWVGDSPLSADSARRWTVFTAAGAEVATLRTPPGLEVMQAGDGFVLGRWRDEDGVERVRVYRIDRS